MQRLSSSIRGAVRQKGFGAIVSAPRYSANSALTRGNAGEFIGCQWMSGISGVVHVTLRKRLARSVQHVRVHHKDCQHRRGFHGELGNGADSSFTGYCAWVLARAVEVTRRLGGTEYNTLDARGPASSVLMIAPWSHAAVNHPAVSLAPVSTKIRFELSIRPLVHARLASALPLHSCLACSSWPSATSLRVPTNTMTPLNPALSAECAIAFKRNTIMDGERTYLCGME